MRMRLILISLILLTLPLACQSTDDYKADADKEVARILEGKQLAAFNDANDISIDWRADALDSVKDQPEGEPRTVEPVQVTETDDEEAAGEGGEKVDEIVLKGYEGPLVKLSLSDALFLSVTSNREYQTQKENVYLSALSLSLERHQWNFIFSGELDGAYVRDEDGEYATDAGASLGFNKLLETGGQISAAIGVDFFRYVSGDHRQTLISTVTMAFSQPLLKGAGRLVAQESLTQAERNTVYQLRDFRRFQQTYALDTATQYFRVLQQKDTLENEQANYDALVRTRERIEWLADAGRQPQFEVDQALQDELEAQDSLARAIESYNQALDTFKVSLSLRTDANVELDEGELERLADRGAVDIPFGEEEATAMALQKRLDFLNAIDRLDDTRRKIKVAENGFLPELNIVGNGAFTSDPDRNNITSWRPRDGRYSLGLEFDANFDRKEERNLYREALITFERAKRRLQQEADQIKLEIRNAFRTFIQARQSYEIQRQSLFLAQRRVESTEMLIQAGEATTRDLLDSQRALLSSRNQVTRDLIDFNVARQELLSAMGILEVDATGMWKWPTHEEFEAMFSEIEPPENILITEDIEDTDERYDTE